MKFDPNKHHRRSIRLSGYDYSQEGYYFITICTQNREHLFGEIIDKKMILNDAGKMTNQWWLELKNKFQNVKLDAYITMPNHFHGIIAINDDVTVGADLRVCPKYHEQDKHAGLPLPQSIPQMIQWFKTMSTNEYIRNVKNNNWQPFDGKLWQRNYYENIIRDEKSLENVREYIINNPKNWKIDKLFT